MFEYDKDAYKAVSVLDQFDLIYALRGLFDAGKTEVFDIREGLALRYPDLEASLDCLAEDELIMYLEDRYPVKFYETVITHNFMTFVDGEKGE